MIKNFNGNVFDVEVKAFEDCNFNLMINGEDVVMYCEDISLYCGDLSDFKMQVNIDMLKEHAYYAYKTAKETLAEIDYQNYAFEIDLLKAV